MWMTAIARFHSKYWVGSIYHLAVPLMLGVSCKARTSKYIACEEEWLRLLVMELSPVIDHLQENDLPLGEP
jgi:hypothetical protein